MWHGRTTADYWNMVGPFGGVTAATLLRAVQLHPDVPGEPLALTVNFAGPIEDGEFEVRAEPVRTNNTAEVAAHGTEHLLGTAFSRRFGRGYFDQTGELWSQDGRLLATSHQLVYFKA